MVKKKISFQDVAMVCSVLFLIFVIFWLIPQQNNTDLPPMLMVENQIYISPRKGMPITEEPDGQIISVHWDKIPDEDGMATFGKEGMDYWILEGGSVCVKCNENFLIFRPDKYGR